MASGLPDSRVTDLAAPSSVPPAPQSNTCRPSCPRASGLSQGRLGAGHAPSGTWMPTTGESITHFLPILPGGFVFNVLRSYRIPSSKCTKAFGIRTCQCSHRALLPPTGARLSHGSPSSPSGTMAMDTRPVLSHGCAAGSKIRTVESHQEPLTPLALIFKMYSHPLCKVI